MQTKTITWKGIEYSIRTLDIRPIPTYEAARYAAVDIADAELWDAIERVHTQEEERMAMAIDNAIFFYCEHGFLKSEPNDEELLNYLKKNLA